MSRPKSPPKPRPSRKRRATTAPNQPPPPVASEFASPPDAERDEFIALMGEARASNPAAFSALMDRDNMRASIAERTAGGLS